MKHFTDTEKKAGRRFFLLSAAIVLALCCATAALALAKPGGSTLYADAGPGAGVEMNVSASGRVKSYAAPEGVTMFDDLGLKGMKADEAVSAAVKAMAENGLVKKGSNTVLLTQTGEQTEKNAALLAKASDAAEKALTECGLNASAAAISRRVVTPDIRTIAEKYGISEGMAALVKTVADGAHVTDVETLSKMSAHDLAVYALKKECDLQLSGTPDTNDFLGGERALKAAMKAINADAAYVFGSAAKLTLSKSGIAYAVTFIYKGRDLHYTVDARTGAILGA